MLCLILQPRQKSKEWVTEGVTSDPHDFNLESKKIHSVHALRTKKNLGISGSFEMFQPSALDR